MKAACYALVLTSMMFACDSDGTPERIEGERAACTFERFSVEITAGPSAPTTLEGKLYLAPAGADEHGDYHGFFEAGDQQYAVNSSYTADGALSVSVALASDHVVGLGHVDALCEADAMIEGVAVGPRVAADNTIAGSDSGHWLLFNGSTTQLKFNYLDQGDGDYGSAIIKIPITEVCTVANATQATCYENFCKAQMAGHYSADAKDGAICS